MSPATDKDSSNKVAKKTAKQTSTKKAAPKKPAPPPDPRAPLAPTQANFTLTLKELRAVLAHLPAPSEPHPGDLVDVCMHIIFVRGLSCAIGQEVLGRIEKEYVDRNEFRLTEAFEIAELLADLEIPDLFDRCLTVKRAMGEIYNDQNGVSLEGLREAVVAERKGFFQRVPAIPGWVANFISDIMSLDELCFSERSTQRVQVRLGFDPKAAAVETFVTELRELMAPYGYLPLHVGPDGENRDLILSPACILQRLAKPGRK